MIDFKTLLPQDVRSNYSAIKGIGAYLPERVVTNFDLEKMVDTTHDWIVERTGIHRRHLAHEEETVASMGEIAARNALENAGITPQDIDLIIVSTASPEKFFPSTACMIQGRLKAKHCMAFDITAACTGFLYALDIANQYIRTGAAKHVLIVSTELTSRLADWQDRNTCVLFGDGAGAVVLTASEEPGIIASQLHSTPDEKDILSMSTGIYDKTPTKYYLTMQGREVFKVAVNYIVDSVNDLLYSCGLTVNQIDWLIPHQANYRIVDLAAEKLNMPREKVIFTLQDHANTSSASIPLALAEAMKARKIKTGDLVMLSAFGSGLTWGSVLVKI